MIDMHLNAVVAGRDEGLTSLSAADVATACRHFAPRIRDAGFARAVMVVLSDSALDDLEDPGHAGRSRLAEFASMLPVALAVDFRRPDAAGRLERARSLGVAALKFHPYLQQIVPADFDRAAALAREAERLGMFVMVCCSYGTRALERHDGVRLAASLAGQIRCPIVMSHAGGRQILDAMLVAADAPQVLLETSFSLPYYVGSTIETDFAFAMRKLGATRWMYGSDAPFVGVTESLECTRNFFERHRFPAADVDQMLHGTAAALLQER
jgi:predicted TIM-barrel fold metal-dependent hydrolase